MLNLLKCFSDIIVGVFFFKKSDKRFLRFGLKPFHYSKAYKVISFKPFGKCVKR